LKFYCLCCSVWNLIMSFIDFDTDIFIMRGFKISSFLILMVLYLLIKIGAPNKLLKFFKNKSRFSGKKIPWKNSFIWGSDPTWSWIEALYTPMLWAIRIRLKVYFELRMIKLLEKSSFIFQSFIPFKHRLHNLQITNPHEKDM